MLPNKRASRLQVLSKEKEALRIPRPSLRKLLKMLLMPRMSNSGSNKIPSVLNIEIALIGFLFKKVFNIKAHRKIKIAWMMMWIC